MKVEEKGKLHFLFSVASLRGFGMQSILLGGKWLTLDDHFPVKDKYSGKVIANVPLCGEQQIEIALESATRGADIAAKMPGYRRAEVLDAAIRLIQAQAQSFEETLVAEAGMPRKYARVEVERAIVTLRFSAIESRTLAGETVPFDAQPRGEDRIGYFVRKPVGTVAAITPFNGPLLLVCRKIGPAVAAGNASVLKPASATPLSAIKFARVIQEAGLPPEALQVATGHGAVVGKKIASDPRVRVVSITGSVQAGEDLAKHAGVKRLIMELGSVCPTIVMDDARTDLALRCLPEAAFGFAGQNCIRPQRLFVHERIYREFVDSLVERTAKLAVGDPASENTEVGPLISEQEAIRVETWVKEAQEMGGRVLSGGIRDGAFYSPTIVADVPPAAKLVRQEVFGPVTTVDRFSRLEQAISQSNDTSFGLQAGIFTQDIDAAHLAAQELNFGAVLINDTSDFNNDLMPFGGTKNSGVGREGVRWAVEAMTEFRTIIFRRPSTTA